MEQSEKAKKTGSVVETARVIIGLIFLALVVSIFVYNGVVVPRRQAVAKVNDRVEFIKSLADGKSEYFPLWGCDFREKVDWVRSLVHDAKLPDPFDTAWVTEESTTCQAHMLNGFYRDFTAKYDSVRNSHVGSVDLLRMMDRFGQGMMYQIGSGGTTRDINGTSFGADPWADRTDQRCWDSMPSLPKWAGWNGFSPFSGLSRSEVKQCLLVLVADEAQERLRDLRVCEGLKADLWPQRDQDLILFIQDASIRMMIFGGTGSEWWTRIVNEAFPDAPERIRRPSPHLPRCNY